jgi:hypothetical protein
MAKIPGDRRMLGDHIHVWIEADVAGHGLADAVGPASNRGPAVDLVDPYDRGFGMIHCGSSPSFAPSGRIGRTAWLDFRFERVRPVETIELDGGD